MKESGNRQSYLDWLRILSIAGVLFFHAAMPFVSEWGWHIKNKETSNLLLEINFWLSRFRMPLLFFISGTVAYFMLQKRSGLKFIGLRFRRLLIPLVFGMLVIVPPQVYMERLTQGFKGNYFDFYSTIFTTGPYPKGNFSWHHLWFIAYLFVFDVVCTPLFVWLIKGRGKIFLQKLNWLAKKKWIYLLCLPSVLIYASLYFEYPETNDLIHDWGRIFYWLLFLLAGFICIANPLLMDSLQRNRRISLSLALLSFGIIAYYRWNNTEPWNMLANWKTDIRTYLYLGLWGTTAWSWMFAAVGYGKKYLNRRSTALTYINQAVYPFYILHQTVIVLVAYYAVKTTDSILMKYLFTAFLSFFLSVIIFHLFIRPFRITRFLFGMKPKE
jgi:peptidoglycan/LPS O-acetylase OafA/YrhL